MSGHFGHDFLLQLLQLFPLCRQMVSIQAGPRKTGRSMQQPTPPKKQPECFNDGETGILYLYTRQHYSSLDSTVILECSCKGTDKLKCLTGNLGIMQTCTRSVLVFCYCMTNYHKLSVLKQYLRIISQLCRSEVRAGLTEFSALGIRKLTSRHLPGWAVTWRLWERTHF